MNHMTIKQVSLIFLAVFSIVGCASNKQTTAKTYTSRPLEVKSMFIFAPPAIFLGVDARYGSGSYELEGFAHKLSSQISIKLNEAGNETSTTTPSRPNETFVDIIRQRNQATGVSHALLISATKGAFDAGILRHVEVVASLYDARTLELLWQTTYRDPVGGWDAIPKAAQAIANSLRESGIAK
jgi:hypothetical protein